MAQPNQLASIQVLDITVKNYTGSDLVEGAAVILDTANKGGISAAPGVVLPASDVGAFGILPAKIPAGRTGVVRVLGTAIGIAGAAVTYGGPVMTNAAGKIVDQTAGKYQIGICLSDAPALDDRVVVFLDRGKNA